MIRWSRTDCPGREQHVFAIDFNFDELNETYRQYQLNLLLDVKPV